MARLGFGAFLAPHHPIGENPMLQFRRDIKFVQHLDDLGYDEFWCGEHHSSGWEMIASPEMFLAAAGEHTKRIKLATGVISLPYHNPFNVAQRMVQLDYMTGGRAIFGSGPGALPSDAYALGIDPMTQRDRQDEEKWWGDPAGQQSKEHDQYAERDRHCGCVSERGASRGEGVERGGPMGGETTLDGIVEAPDRAVNQHLGEQQAKHEHPAENEHAGTRELAEALDHLRAAQESRVRGPG